MTNYQLSMYIWALEEITETVCATIAKPQEVNDILQSFKNGMEDIEACLKDSTKDGHVIPPEPPIPPK